MSGARSPLPQLEPGFFLTDGGLETVLVFQQGLELNAFAAFPLLETADGRDRLRAYYGAFLQTAAELGAGFVLETPTWRANPDWAAVLGYDRSQTERVNRDAVAFMTELRDLAASPRPVLVSGCIGPRGDGYRIDAAMAADEAEAYHSFQVGVFSDAGADLVTALTIGYAEEAIGIARAAHAANIPAVISFTVETDGMLPSGHPLGASIQAVDDATGGIPAYYMVNCAHPTHLAGALGSDGPWRRRVRGLRSNASMLSHAELDEATELDDGDPGDLAARYVQMRTALPELSVLGGCCGTDHRHVEAIGRAWLADSLAAD